MIIGVDSGAWRAFAVVDFNGTLLAVKSRKNWSPEEFLRDVSEFSPTIIACDKSVPPKKVLELRTAFGARLYAPKHSLTLIEKHSLTDGLRVRNAHERDALASALKAWKSLNNILLRVDKRMEKAGVKSSPEAKRKVLLGSTVNSVLKKN